MLLPQLSVFVENKTGVLNGVINILANNSINIRGLSLAETKDFGILRLILDKPYKALELLKKNNYTTILNEVIAVEVKDEPGGLAKVLNILAEKGINVEYMYGFLEKNKDNAIIVLRIDDIERAIDILIENNVTLVKRDDLELI